MSRMIDETRILKVEMDDGEGLIVTFSDGTTAGYVAEELLYLRPYRETVEESLNSDRPKGSRAPHSHHMQRGWRAHG